MKKDIQNKILNRLLYEFKHHIRNELYSICQFKLAARSNGIEGNTMSEDDTAMLFDTQQIPSIKYIAKEIEEAQGHFLMFNEMLKSIHLPLSIDIIKRYHKALTEGIFEFKANGGVPGEFKKRPNIAGTMETTEPDKVESELNELIRGYNKIDKISIKDLASFHYEYERIHPFQDYNGRTGRMILFGESLKHFTPIVINVNDRREYVDSLIKARNSAGNIESLSHYLEIWQNSFYKEIEKYI